jgi:hypothetical protein
MLPSFIPVFRTPAAGVSPRSSTQDHKKCESQGVIQGEFTIDTVVTVGGTGPEWSGYRQRRIFLAHS